jgi:hypothetical protein
MIGQPGVNVAAATASAGTPGHAAVLRQPWRLGAGGRHGCLIGALLSRRLGR